jgi:hypothetical protein
MDSPEKQPQKPKKQAKTPKATPKTGTISKVGSPNPDQVRQVVSWFVEGATDHEVRQLVASTWPGTDPQPLIAQAYLEFAAHSLRPQISGESPRVQDVVRGWCFVAYRDLYRKLLETGDLTGALAAVAKIERMGEK